MNAFIKRTKRSQINNLMAYLKLLEKQEQAKSEAEKYKNKGQN
jgi:hypothetical protein